MKPQRIVLLVALAAIIGLGIFAVTRNDDTQKNSDKLQVAATYYPLYDFARNVAGDKAAVTNITPAGAEPHDFDPSPKTLVDTQKADVFIYNGGTMEPWVDKFIHDYKHVAVKASSGIDLLHGEDHHEDEAGSDGHEEEGEALDPHFWLDPVLAQKIVNNIRDGLIKADPANKDAYAANAKAYNAKLAQLDSDIKDGLSTCNQNTVISSHEAMSYYAKRYGFTAEAISGISTEQEPSAARMAEIADLVKEKNINYIFFESLVSPRLADTIAQETGAKTLVFDPIEGLSNEGQEQGKNYLSIQKENLRNVELALACS
jgi:zinc transport system substrate-binding protein